MPPTCDYAGSAMRWCARTQRISHRDVTLAFVVAAGRETIDNLAAWGNRAAGNAALKFVRD